MKVYELEEMVKEKDNITKDLQIKVKDYEDQLAALEIDHREKEAGLMNKHREQYAELQRKENRTKKLIKELDEQLKVGGNYLIPLFAYLYNVLYRNKGLKLMN